MADPFTYNWQTGITSTKNPPPAPMITEEQKSFLPQKKQVVLPQKIDPNKTSEAFKKRFIEKNGDGVAEDGRKYSQIPADEIVVKVIRKYGDGKTTDGIPYRDFLPKPASPNDSLEYRLKQIESLSTAPKSNFYTPNGTIRGQTKEEEKFTTKVTNVQNEGEIMKTLKAPYRGLESVGQNIAYGTAGVGADVVDLFGGDKLADKIRKTTEQEQFKSGLLSGNKGFIGGIQSGELSSVIETLSSGAGYMLTAAKIPLYLMALTQGGNLSLEGEQQGQGSFGDKAIAYSTGLISSAIDRMSGNKVIDGLTRTGIKKETATTFVQKMNNYLKGLKPSDFEAGTEVIQQKIENIGRDLMGVNYDKGIQQYFEAGLLGKILGKVGDKGFSESSVTVLPLAPQKTRGTNKNIETLKTIKVGKRANNSVLRNESRGFDPYTDIATHQEIVPTVDKTGLVRTYEQVQNLEDTLDPINDTLTKAIADEGIKIPLDEFLIDSLNAAKEYQNEGASYDKYVNQIRKDFEVYKRFADEQGMIDLSKINEIKKAKYGISNFTDLEADKANKMVGKAAKNLVEKYAKTQSVQAINKELSRWYSARDLLLAMDGKTVKGGRLGKMAARVGGNIIGSYFGPLGSFAGGEISAAIQGQMMKGSLKTPTGNIDTESILGKIPKKTPAQLPQASQNSEGRKVVLPMQSQPVSEWEGLLPKAEATTKKDVSGSKITPPIIQKIEKKQFELPKAKPEVKATPTNEIKSLENEIKLKEQYIESMGDRPVGSIASDEYTRQVGEIGALKDRLEYLKTNTPTPKERGSVEVKEVLPEPKPAKVEITNEMTGYKKTPLSQKTLEKISDIDAYIENATKVNSRYIQKYGREKFDIEARKMYEKEVKTYISKGYDVPKSIIDTNPEFSKAVDARARYEKGLYTSFSNADVRIESKTKDIIGGGVKRQDGKPITPEQTKEIVDGVQQFADTMGLDIKKLAEEQSLVFVHLNGKNPFLMNNTSGLYRQAGDKISVSVGGTESAIQTIAGKRVSEKVHTTMSHELAHTMDFMKKQGLTTDLQYIDGWRSYNPVDDFHDYYRKPVERTARMIEQLVEVKKGNTNYYDKKGYWKKELFDKMIPEIEKSLKTRYSDYIKGATTKKSSLPLAQREAVKYMKIDGKQIINDFIEENGKPYISGRPLRWLYRKDGVITDVPEDIAKILDREKYDIASWGKSGKVTKTSNNLYHTTKVENLDSIAKTGLKTGMKPRYEGVSSPNKISFSANEEGAKYYGGPNDVMLRTKRGFKPDDLDYDLLAGGEGTYTTGKNIPPELLEVKIKGKWIPITEYNK